MRLKLTAPPKKYGIFQVARRYTTDTVRAPSAKACIATSVADLEKPTTTTSRPRASRPSVYSDECRMAPPAARKASSPGNGRVFGRLNWPVATTTAS